MFKQNETIYVGNSYESSVANGRINRYNSSNGYVEIANSQGIFSEGDIIYGVHSNFSIRLSEFNIMKIDAPDAWEDNFITQDNGEVIAEDAHFTGLDIQEYQKDHLIVEA